MKIKFCACDWRINIWTFILDSSASAIWYFCSVSVIVLVFHLLFSFCNLVFAFSFCNVFWSDILSSASAKSGISTFLQFLQFGISVLSLQLFWYFFFSSVSAIWYLRSVSVIFLEWYFVFRFYKIWYFDIPSASAIWYFCFVSVIVLVFRLLFSFCNLVFVFSFCNVFWSDILSFASAKSGISTFFQLLQFRIYVLSLQLFCFCHDIYYQRDYLVTLVTCWYESFLFSSYSYVLWQLEFYSDCS